MKGRTGSYKVILLDEKSLRENRDVIYSFIDHLITKYNNSAISSQDFTTSYLLFFLKLKYKSNYFQKFKTIPDNNTRCGVIDFTDGLIQFDQYEKDRLKNVSGLDLFRCFNLKGVPKSVCRAMENWYLNNWDIVLSFDIPSSKSLLKLQAQNKRVLTLIVDKNRVTTLILGKRDPLSFAIHDLMHADQFFNNLISQKGQLGFYRFILQIYDNEILINLFLKYPSFKNEFEYVVSDMNAYIVHLLKSFVSTFSRINKVSELKTLIESTTIPVSLISLILNINSREIDGMCEKEICEFFENN